MKILFVYPDVLYHRPDWGGYFYVGIGLLSAVLKQQGHQTSLLHVRTHIGEQEFIDRVRAERPDLIAYSSTSHMFPLVKKFSAWIGAAGIRVATICGGIHPTIAPEEVISVPGIDMVCRGEGEEAIAELCTALQHGRDFTDIRNLWVKRNGSILKNPLRPVIANLDSLPFSDRSIFDYQNLYAEREGRGSFMVARGCPYDCTYCCNHLVRKVYNNTNRNFRFRSVDHVIAEIKEVLQQYPFITSLIFDDDILFLKQSWSEEFTDKYAREIGLPFACNARANLVNESTIQLLKKAGCHIIKFGLESGNEHIVNHVLRRNLKNDAIRRAFSLSRQAGLHTESFNMIGIPYETPVNVLETIKLNAEIRVNEMQVTIYQPYEGTQLAELCKEKGFLRQAENHDLETDFFSPSRVQLDTISASQTLMFRNYFKLLVRYYRVLQNLRAGSRFAIRTSDAVLTSRPVSHVLNVCHVPLNYIFRKWQLLQTNLKVAKTKRAFRLRTEQSKVGLPVSSSAHGAS